MDRGGATSRRQPAACGRLAPVSVSRPLVALAAMLLVVLSGSTGAVWCIAEDHASVEWSGEPCCEAEADAVAASAGLMAAADGCGPCLDLGLAGSATAPPPAPGPTLVPAVAAVAVPPRAIRCAPRVALDASVASDLDGTCLRL